MNNALSNRVSALPRDSRDTLFLLAVIGWVLLPQAGRLPWWCSLLAAAVLAWRGGLAVQGKPLPGKAWILGLLALTLGATLMTHRTLLGRDAGVTLVVVLLALKTLELRARRDAFVIFFLAFFTMLTNFFFSQSLATAGMMLVGLLGLLTALVNAHMPVGRPPLSEAARTAGWMTLLGAPVMAVLFVLFPRFGPLWGIPADAMSGRSGLSSQMAVGNVARLALDDSIALRVRFEGQPPARSDLYFRGPVLGGFDGRNWRALYTSPATLPDPAVTARRAPVEVTGSPVRYEVTQEPSNRPWLLVLDIAATAPQLPGQQVIGTPEMQWLLARPATDLLRYQAESYVRWRQGPRESPGLLPPDYRELPPGSNPRTLQLAAELLQAHGGASNRAALVEAAMQRLRTGGYTYTLEPGVYGADTADEFWFDRKQGFCEHIASAFAVLMRGMGIPARIVTGYQGGELNPVDGYWVLRQSDAHAWVEVWLAGRGWVRVDPTSAVAPDRTGTLRRLVSSPGLFGTAVDAVDPTLGASLRAAWEAMNNAWNQQVLNYTQSRQLNLLRRAGFHSPDWQDLARVLMGLMVLVATLGVVWAWWERRQNDPWLRLLARARKKLEKQGLALPSTHGPRQIATAASLRWGPQARELADWLLRLEAQRYARKPQARLSALRREFKHLSWPT